MATDTLATPASLSHSQTRVFKNFIDGEWVESSTGETSKTAIPPTPATWSASFRNPARADVDAAVDAAKRAFAKWRLVPAPRRAEIVFRAAEILIERKEEYARDMTREMGKVLEETRGDVQEAIDAAYYNAGEGRRLFGPTVPSEMPNKFAMAVRQPIGVCGMITPWNFPMAISSWKLLPAIVCGNTCVIKPAQDTPLSTFNLVRALTDAGVPKGVINIVTGFGAEVGTPLAEHPDVRAISLTGSSAVAASSAASRPRVQALLARTRRQESHDRARRCQSRSRHRRRPLGSIRHHRPALHRDQPHHRAERRVPRISSNATWSARRS